MGKRIMGGSLAGLGILFLILDAPTALAGARDGIELCLYSIVPSIFPFLVLSAILTSNLLGAHVKILHPLGRLVGIPKGTEGLFLAGLLGGYPIGAQAVTQAWEQGQLSKKDARRMLAFCSNAGPSFLFGILGIQFSNSGSLWLLWIIHIVSAIAVGTILSGKSLEGKCACDSKPMTLPSALRKSVITMGMICGWVILFRIILSFLDRWILWLLPVSARICVYGFLELANGCCSLSQINTEGLRFVIASCMLSFGGVCVYLQTVSVTGKLGTGKYLLGKTMQLFISLLCSMSVQYFLFSTTERINISPFWMLLSAAAGILLIGIYRIIKKKSSIPALIGV